MSRAFYTAAMTAFKELQRTFSFIEKVAINPYHGKPLPILHPTSICKFDQKGNFANSPQQCTLIRTQDQIMIRPLEAFQDALDKTLGLLKRNMRVHASRSNSWTFVSTDDTCTCIVYVHNQGWRDEKGTDILPHGFFSLTTHIYETAAHTAEIQDRLNMLR